MLTPYWFSNLIINLLNLFIMDPKEREGMSLNEQIYQSSAENGSHPLKYADDWEKDEDDFEDDGAHCEDDE
jgi:hypothetical protein